MASNADTPKRFLDPSVIDNRCRTCWIELSGGQRYRIFSVEAVRSGLRARIKIWFGCEVSSEDGLPDSICRRCYRKLEAAQKLVNEIAQIKHEAIVTATAEYSKRPVSSVVGIHVHPDKDWNPRVRPPLAQGGVQQQQRGPSSLHHNVKVRSSKTVNARWPAPRSGHGDGQRDLYLSITMA